MSTVEEQACAAVPVATAAGLAAAGQAAAARVAVTVARSMRRRMAPP
jgi:hypothetical protein